MYDTWTYGRDARAADDGILVLSVTYGGQVYRWTSREPWWTLEGTPAPGTTVPIAFVGSWDPPADIDLGEPVSALVVFPAGLGVAAAEVRGRVRLTGASAELAFVPASGAWNDRVVMVAGMVSEPDIGSPDEPVAFTLRPWAHADDLALLPPVDRAVTTATWPAAPEGSLGQGYPLVYGRPGEFVDETGAEVRVPACPAIVVDSEVVTVDGADVERANTLLINWVPCLPSTQVRVWTRLDASSTGWRSTVVTPEFVEDARGQRVTVADISGKSDELREGGTFYVSWSGGGATPLDTTADTDAAATVIEWWLRRSSVVVDWRRTRSALAALGGLTLSGYVDESVAPMDWITDRLADYPLRVVDGPCGVFLVPVRHEATAADAVARVVVTSALNAAAVGAAQGCVRVSPLRCEGDGRATEVWVRWARDLANGTFRRATVVTTDGLERGTDRILDPSLAEPTRGRRVVSVELPDCWASSTAGAIGRYVAWRDGLPRRRVIVAVPTAELGHLLEGDVVTYSDEDLGLVDVVALVDQIAPTIGPLMEMTLDLLR